MTCVNRARYLHKVYSISKSPYNSYIIICGGGRLKVEYKELYEKFGLNIVFYRKKKKLTQLQLAELVDIDRSHISAIELGKVGVSFDVVF